ncbi:unnamed protein product [Caenorhabditis angaria]|uniref:NADPH:adrenodoxin oxidoreductase, mitochondrial n=1 Tax=Caenorhabditis angaria TaxID=860376 RepID=A0A9P1N4M3_9PELO|nr:unnamed protein product [Caenorhabditis angaria]
MLKRRHAVYIISRCFASRLAIVGSGPAGMFACNGVLRRKQDVFVDVFEHSPVPFGLVRYGVAPDHQEVKNVINTFDTMFEKNRDRLRLFCNVSIGRDIKFEELLDNYDAILLAYGSYKTRTLQIPGSKNTKNVISGSEFVGWYNGMPNISAPNNLENVKNVIIVGNGNVALDCARILSSSKSGDGKLRISDIPNDRLDLLEKSGIENIKILGRRGPENVSFTIKELKEQFKVEKWSSKIEISPEDQQKLQNLLPTLERKKKRLTEVILKNSGKSQGERKCQFLFHWVPKEVIANKDGFIEKIRVENVEKNGQEIEELPCDLLIYSIGYETIVLDGVPKNEKKMIDMKDHCRVNLPNSSVYATGWCAHGPKGVIVDTQQQSIFVAEEIVSDFENAENANAPPKTLEILKSRKIPFLSWDAWKKIDNEERDLGKKTGKVREKLTQFDRPEVYFKMESKILDGPNVGYCSSSEGEEEDFKVVKDEDEHQANVMKKFGPSSNTGAKGVLSDFKAFREQTKLAMEQKNQYFLEQAKRGMMMGSKEEREKAQKEEDEFELEESELDEIRRKRMLEMKKMAQNKIIEIVNKNQYSDAIDGSNKYLLAVLIYEPENEECAKLTYLCKVLAADYGNVKFIRATSRLLGMSDAFRANGVPCLQFYKDGNLIGNFVRISAMLGQDGDVAKLRKFLRKQHIDLINGGYASDSDDGDDED